MTSLEELRTQLSDVDDQITDLYEKRMKICEDLGTCKIKMVIKHLTVSVKRIK